MIKYRPGDQIHTFKIFRPSVDVSSRGRVGSSVSDELQVGTLEATISVMDQREIDRWKQNGYPVTHKVSFWGQTDAQLHDFLVLDDSQRRFYVQGKKNVGEMDLAQTFYCEERPGMNVSNTSG